MVATAATKPGFFVGLTCFRRRTLSERLGATTRGARYAERRRDLQHERRGALNFDRLDGYRLARPLQ
jgi:hypothetical protein